MATTVTVKVYFEAAHRLHNPAQPDDWNLRIFGKCNNPHGHGHNYVIEAVVRGYLAGSGYKDYQREGTVSGIALPPGLQHASELDPPILTPSTKAESVAASSRAPRVSSLSFS